MLELMLAQDSSKKKDRWEAQSEHMLKFSYCPSQSHGGGSELHIN